MGLLKMLVDHCTQEISALRIAHCFELVPYRGAYVFLFLVDNFDLSYLSLWLPAFGFFSHPFLAIPFEVPWLFAEEAHSCLLVVRYLCDIYIHAVFGADVVMASLLIQQAQEVGFLLCGVLAVPLDQLMLCLQPSTLVFYCEVLPLAQGVWTIVLIQHPPEQSCGKPPPVQLHGSLFIMVPSTPAQQLIEGGVVCIQLIANHPEVHQLCNGLVLDVDILERPVHVFFELSPYVWVIVSPLSGALLKSL
jgi:hypothetical protein